MKDISKTDIVDILINKLGLKANIAANCVDIFFKEISDALISGETVKISRLGTLNVIKKKERVGMNPLTKQQAVIKARKAVSFRCSGVLRKKLNEED